MELPITFPSSFEAKKPERLELIKSCITTHIEAVKNHNYTHYVFTVAYNSKCARVLEGGQPAGFPEKTCKVTYSDIHGITVASE